MQENPYTASAETLIQGGIPACLVQTDEAVFVDISKISSGAELMAAVDQLFCSGFYFAALDYAQFTHLLYEFDTLDPATLNSPMVKLAGSITPFSEQRHSLYRAVKIEPGQAEYYFEPVFIERSGPQGHSLEPTRLNVDEFIAYLWERGVKFGVDIAAVRAAIHANKAARQVVARARPVDPGMDAGIQELCAEIHRSDAPREKSNGRLDLAQFKNRFPQVKKGIRLLRKVPRVHGNAGIDIHGNRIEPKPPKDCDLSILVGEGTELVHAPEGEFIVSLEEGFLNLDPETNKISIGKKIVNHEGVSGRTTGNLSLTANTFEEFGEVQEKRIVEGNNITIHGVVFGNIHSRGGTVVLNSNLMGGTVSNKKGDIILHGTAASAVVQAFDGEAVIHRAEGSLLTGKKLRIEHASQCEIIAEEVDIKHAEGCIIAANRINIEQCAPRKQTEMQLLALVPDTAKYEQLVRAAKLKIEEFEKHVVEKTALAEAIPEQADVKKYIAIISKVKNKEVTLTTEQAAAVQKLAQKVAPELKQAAKLDVEIKELNSQIQEQQQEIERIQHLKQSTLAQIHCRVRHVQGDTQLRLMSYNPEGDALFLHPAKEIKAKLRHQVVNGTRQLLVSQGELHWQHAED